MEECIEVIDSHGRVVDVLPRTQVHARGLRHRVVHVWAYTWQNETCWVYLQRRSFEKQQAPLVFAGVQHVCAKTPHGVDDEECHVFIAQVDAPDFAPGEEVIAMKKVPLCQLQQMACGQRTTLELHDLQGSGRICVDRAQLSGFCEAYVRATCAAILSQRRA